MGGKVDKEVNRGRGPYVFKIGGQNYHRIGSLLLLTRLTPKISQLYIYDTQNEVDNRICALGSNNDKNTLDSTIIEDLLKMTDQHNSLAKAFRMARNRFNYEDGHENITLKIIGSRSIDGRTYNLPKTNEIVALIVGDIGI
ncbi:unnamed protein product [Amaranthus hypochondriacus]